MYLKVVNGTKSKEYTLTSQYNEKPYMIVSGANKLPLTTKPPVDYASSSESRTFYTTAENAENLRETTALTRQSTYETIYGTRASTYNTVYGVTQTVLSSATLMTDYDQDHVTSYYGISSVSSKYNDYYVLLKTIWGNPVSWTGWAGRSGSATIAYFGGGQTLYPIVAYSTSKKTTGTTYLTRASTSETYYLTNSSTYGYQGISSSSSSTSYNTSPGVNAYLKIIKGTKTLRPLEYRLSSESASMYTTVNPDEWYLISDITALTRESTSGTIYETRASTSTTLYGVAQTVLSSATLRTDYDDYHVTSYYKISRVSAKGNNKTIWGNPVSWTGWAGRSGTATIVYFGMYDTLYPIVAYSTSKKTTGTTYLTRASTSKTVYLTCESTSAYSGVSSSSQSAMVWV